jgi:exosortase
MSKKEGKRSEKPRGKRFSSSSQSGRKPPLGLSGAESERKTPASEDTLDQMASGFGLRAIASAVLLAVFAWSYWPSAAQLVSEWQSVPDYSHGFLVVPLAIYFLFARRDVLPAIGRPAIFTGILLLTIAAALRVVSARYYLEPLSNWSIPVWVAGCVALIWGLPILRWSAGAIAFLFFMFPLPYTLELMLSGPLQRISTTISTFALQSLLMPAIAEGNTILLGSEQLEVARACSGLRIFMGIAAMAFAFLLLFRRPLATVIMIIMAILPIALIANSARIVITGILYHAGWGEAANRLSHDLAGWFMVPLAAGLFGLTLFYLDRLFIQKSSIDAASLVRHQTSAT